MLHGIIVDTVPVGFQRVQTVQIDLTGLNAATDGMNVTVLQSGQYHLALQVDHSGRWTNEGFGIFVGTDKDDAFILQRDGFGPAAVDIDRIDGTVTEHEVGLAGRIVAH